MKIAYDPEALEPSFIRKGLVNMRVTDDVRKCVAFIGIKDKERFVPKATAFFATVEDAGL